LLSKRNVTGVCSYSSQTDFADNFQDFLITSKSHSEQVRYCCSVQSCESLGLVNPTQHDPKMTRSRLQFDDFEPKRLQRTSEKPALFNLKSTCWG